MKANYGFTGSPKMLESHGLYAKEGCIQGVEPAQGKEALLSTKLEAWKNQRAIKLFDIRHGAPGFEVCPARFQSCFVQYTLTMTLLLSFGMIMPLYVVSLGLAFALTKGYN